VLSLLYFAAAHLRFIERDYAQDLPVLIFPSAVGPPRRAAGRRRRRKPGFACTPTAVFLRDVPPTGNSRACAVGAGLLGLPGPTAAGRSGPTWPLTTFSRSQLPGVGGPGFGAEPQGPGTCSLPSGVGRFRSRPTAASAAAWWR